MGVVAGLYLYVVVVQKFTFAISSPDEFLFIVPVKLLAANIKLTNFFDYRSCHQLDKTYAYQKRSMIQSGQR